MRRREFIGLISVAAAWPLAARAQRSDRVRRVGFLFAGTISLRPQAQEFWRALGQLGYIEGRNLTIEVREARGDWEQLPKLASELVALRPDVIVAVTAPALVAVSNATQDIPIVMAIVGDPLGHGFVKSLAHPEGNITGAASSISFDIVSKRLELLKQMLPSGSVVGILWNPLTKTEVGAFTVAEGAAKSMGLATKLITVAGASDLEAAFDRIFEARVNAVFVMSDPVTFDHRREIIEFALANKIPMFHSYPDEAAEGALAAYGNRLSREYRRPAVYVAKILDGVAVADLPIDQASTYEFAINLKTAEAIGFTFPPAVLALADEVIE
jgi:putative ABC transport system substrate-binding protein